MITLIHFSTRKREQKIDKTDVFSEAFHNMTAYESMEFV